MNTVASNRPARKGNVPRVGGYIAWLRETVGGYLERGARAKVLRCETGQRGGLAVSVQGGPPINVEYFDVYPCEPPGAASGTEWEEVSEREGVGG